MDAEPTTTGPPAANMVAKQQLPPPNDSSDSIRTAVPQLSSRGHEQPVSEVIQLPSLEQEGHNPRPLPAYSDLSEPHLGAVQPATEAQNLSELFDHLPSQPSSSTWITGDALSHFGFATDLDLSTGDLSFLDTYNSRIPFEAGHTVISPALNIVTTASVTTSSAGPSSRSAQCSAPLPPPLGRFAPAAEDHGYAEQGNLSLPHESDPPHESSGIDHGLRIIRERLTVGDRDKILAIILNQMRPRLSQAISSFPSVELLDRLIQFFLGNVSGSGENWIHCNSLSPQRARPELFLGMAAAGAVLTPEAPLQKLGFAIQEALRHHLSGVFESNNSMILDLGYLQTCLLVLKIGLWSGNSRKIEIAESFQQPVITMLRRRCKFSFSEYPGVSVATEDEGATLDEKWMSWVRQESYKRLVLELLRLNVQTSISLRVVPLISYSELSLGLPYSTELWTASNANEWKALLLGTANQYGTATVPAPRLSDCIMNMDLLDHGSGMYDRDESCAAFLHCLWGLVWEFQRLSLLRLNSNPRYWDDGLIISSRYQELMKILGNFRISYSHQSTLMLDLILMHLHCPIEDIQVFCGSGGRNQEVDPIETANQGGGPNRGYAGLQDHHIEQSIAQWAGNRRGRQAIWHAGQVLRAARALPLGQLRDFTGIAVYHASLTLLAYGSIRSHTTGTAHMPTASTEEPALKAVYADESMISNIPTNYQEPATILLDGKESLEVTKYIELEWGSPAIHRPPEIKPEVLFGNRNRLIDLFVATLRQNAGAQSNASSPLIQNLVVLLERLKEAAG